MINLVIFLIFTAWWLVIKIFFPDNFFQKELWSDLYWLMALCGGLLGLVNARVCGYWKTSMGRALIFFSIGLFCQVFGQVLYVYYSLVHDYQVMYPSLGDLGYSATILLYVVGVIYLGKSIRVSLVRFWRHLWLIMLIFVLIFGALSYPMFLHSFQALKISWWGMVLGVFSVVVGAFYLSLAIFNYFFSQEKMMGVFGLEIKFVFFALLLQFFSDYIFWYEFGGPGYFSADWSDMVYLVAYFLMGVSIIKLRSGFENIKVVSGRDYQPQSFLKQL